jgi:hypothetical protein
VDTLSDAIDVSIGDGACATAGRQCTLRGPVIAANSLPGDDTITFRVAGTFALKLLVLAEVERLDRPQAASQKEQELAARLQRPPGKPLEAASRSVGTQRHDARAAHAATSSRLAWRSFAARFRLGLVRHSRPSRGWRARREPPTRSVRLLAFRVPSALCDKSH